MRVIKRIPSIGAVMTAFPHAVDATAPLEQARRMMAEHGVHHLPVTEGEQLVGVLDDRALGVAVRTRAELVGEACVRDPLIVDLSRRLDGVTLEMAERRTDSVLVTHHGKLVGILTNTDICRLLGQTLREVFTPPSGNDAA
jgi:acetoin utilization protein AcuB